MKYSIALLLLFFTFHKSIDALNPWWRLLILPIVLIIIHYRKDFNTALTNLFESRRAFLIIKIIFLLLLTFRVGKSAYNIYRPLKAIEDIAVVHKKSIDLLFKKSENPYKHILFEQAPITIIKNGKNEVYSGFIYTPLGILYYAPFILLIGKKGMYLGNFFAYWSIFFLLLSFIRKSSLQKMYLAGILYLSIDYIFTKAFNRGTNDFMPALLMFGSLLLGQREDIKSGVLLGLSLAFKQYPGAILSVIYLGWRKVLRLIIAGVVFLLILLPFIINDFQSLYRQIFEVFIYAPMGNTILRDIPSSLVWIVSLIGVSMMFLCILKFKETKSWSGVLFPFLIFIIFTKSSFTTYFICIFPISILWFLDIPRYIKEK